MKLFLRISALAGLLTGVTNTAQASEAALVLPELHSQFTFLGTTFHGEQLLYGGLFICLLGMLFGLMEYGKIKDLPAHQSMLDVSKLIYETCKTYLIQQGKLLIVLELFIAACIFYYFLGLRHFELSRVMLIFFWSVVGILGSY